MLITLFSTARFMDYIIEKIRTISAK
jgi:hypothetical protein